MTKDDALKLALEFIERVNKDGWILADFEPQMYATIAAIKQALAQPERDNTYVYASSLATAIWQKHYIKESPKFALLDTTEGVLTQIDNMTCGLVREKLAQPEPEQEAVGYWKENAQGLQRDYDLLLADYEKLAQPEQEPYGIALTNIPHPQGVSAPDDLNADALEVVELELPDECEAVGWADDGVINWIADKQFKHASFLYPTPPQRTFVGLTEEEIFETHKQVDSMQYLTFAKAIEAKLKEKNT